MLAYLKTSPTTYVLHYQRGRLRRQGTGLAFWNWVRKASRSMGLSRSSDIIPSYRLGGRGV